MFGKRIWTFEMEIKGKVNFEFLKTTRLMRSKNLTEMDSTAEKRVSSGVKISDN